ncbi:hypothetical protein JCGZ_09296 [Jatropha curcas]|uniref:non-specific serine/threonine protein kinase n=1 Tax=Jatropha curcas TaxID=180498 RepID=A0A067KJ04_JATCU|nr:LEAF RUST 10 DISEASE-RESISTANCE LOCUS RECEPTOR-LIKE PROTEIN KINASE-like 2.7 [Jatropha curcas]KDP35008.1 hypothetical protein JCGZ_09296 [Jatropha curcas]
MKTQESSAISHLLLFSLLIFLFKCKVESRNLQEKCSSSCGYLKNISYPFRLTTDPTFCGDSDYEISCEDNKPILEFHLGKYLVYQISYDRLRIRLVDINLANGSCSLPYMSISVDEVRGDRRYRGLVSSTFTSFVNCSSEINDQGYREVPCSSRNGSNVYVSYDKYIISDLQGSCSFISRVPTIYQNVLYPSYESILKLMALGFDLEWSVECRDCIVSGGSCSLSSLGTSNIYECHFSDFNVPILVGFIVGVIWDILLAINLIARFILAPIVIVAFLIHKYRTKKTEDDKEKFLPNQQSLVPKRYSYSDVVAITSNFKDKLGQGCFGTVYKGQIRNGLVAVKILGSSKFSDEDFINEVSTIGKIHHVNVVRLVGFCSEGSHRILLFEYMANKSLDKYIFSREMELLPLSWERLLEIALGTARGIEHLHIGCDVCILHFDIKPHNVLLDQNFIPKVSDFGLAKFYPKEYDFVSVSTTRGTIGYIAPELISKNVRAVSCKSDVYSFGMLLLEMVRGKRNIDVKGDADSSGKDYFPSWVYDHINEGGDLELENVSKVEAAIAKKLCIVGLWCIQKNASDRPLMTKVVEMLQGRVDDLQLPRNPLAYPDYIATEEAQSDSSTELLISETVEQSL